MKGMESRIARIKANPSGVKFIELAKICTFYFGPPRHDSGSHHIYSMPWQGDPRINIQRNNNGMAKFYQVKQVVAALDKLEEMNRD
ncbi:toxin HicA [Yersinia ruckeri]|uniref:Toxin HicA n=1 Tax=Yersinia ruckeri TaxID=29486 RepID=A0A085U3J7_YERRU|nr:hypothetical protein [Yersinia ruckeri]AKA38619.1 toxin HicA [Yersinia ruckeri]ARZ02711.1 hypothetical protein QMA0440_03428 [Yersinia ruckeri]AUQ41429.1 toxin HicA [Yersinia ruckeri]EEP99382.1 hypothetical protein yruck0001_30440 [Yersinia ruckeri ATCC 29473]EKN3347412.1 toxin HicA [Yersinia ruckeri]